MSCPVESRDSSQLKFLFDQKDLYLFAGLYLFAVMWMWCRSENRNSIQKGCSNMSRCRSGMKCCWNLCPVLQPKSLPAAIAIKALLSISWLLHASEGIHLLWQCREQHWGQLSGRRLNL